MMILPYDSLPKAKGLLSQMLSLSEEWDYSLKGLARINKESVDAVRTAVLELEKAGYVVREQTRASQGTFSQTSYTIYEEPHLDLPISENPITDNPTTDKPISDNPTQLNTNQENKKELNTDDIKDSSNLISSLNPCSCECGNVETSDEMRKDEKRNNKHNNYDYWKGQIQINLDYESLKIAYPYDLKLIDEIIEIMVETVMSNGDTIQIASNKYPHSVVKERFLNVDYGHVQYIIDCFKENAKLKEIKNIKQYLKAVIFNAPATIDSYYTAMVQHDMYGY
ncbi:helix-turn-helix domain-containing protein [Eubacterium sp. BIOML-A1]|nr:helix-turn-helix domain-containing protein [Eubacterium sp. BIOML-A1]MSD07301.1 helix-turn-helix domain-containing protein [Eubacterium sp. BIOML-A2]